jgi:isoleucyl-tRNA synthetase
MTDYKDTLNLPKTDFPMRGNLPQKEPQILAKWQESNLFEKIRKQNKGKKKFILHMGPPYANGDIHIGHAVTTILKDMIVKAKTLSGFDAPLVPGWDCHGLPIELNVEMKIGLANVVVTPSAFRKACEEYAKSQIALQKASFIRLGIIGDWENPYLTMDYRYQANIMRSFGKVLENGYVIQGAKPVHWCISCGSALAEAEVEYQDKTSLALDVCFPVKDKKILEEKIGQLNVNEVSFVIWTTTPWTLPANQAVALNPESDYVIVKGSFNGVRGEAICVVKDLLEACMARYGCNDYEIIATFKGEKVNQLALKHPFYEKDVPVVLGEHVTLETGTGLVHTAPGHGLDDYIIGKHYDLPIYTPVDERGCFYQDTPLVGGLSVFKANDKIAEILKEHQTLLHAAQLNHSYPHCWRHKTPLIFRATKQWFISMESQDLRAQVLKAIDKVEWVPSWGRARIRTMIEGRPDWCISRQRTWGVPLPLLIHNQTGALHPRMKEIIEVVSQRVEKEGVDVWYALDLNTLPFDDLQNYTPSQDILDVWFDSGVSHTAVLKTREDLQFPADLYLEGSDQHRGWFQSSLLSSMTMYQVAPYRTVLTHGFTVDAQGRKMSKSLGNVVAPEKVVKNLGADVLRLWVSATDYKGEIHVSDEILKRMADAYRRIRNTIRFLLANLDGFDPSKNMVKPESLVALDAWIIDYAATLQNEIIEAYDNYQFHNIYQKVHNFCVVELGSFYLDVIKDRQYTTKENSLARRSAQTAMYYIAHALTRWLAPILSYTCEEIWQVLPGTSVESVFLSEWLSDMPRLQAGAGMDNAFWQTMINVRSIVNKALEEQRAQGKIGAPLDAKVTLYAEGERFQQLSSLQEELRFVLITSEAKVKSFAEKGEGALATEDPLLAIMVEVSGDEKCIRCWHHRPEVGKNPTHPQICDRCISNVETDSQGEARHYA